MTSVACITVMLWNVFIIMMGVFLVDQRGWSPWWMLGSLLLIKVVEMKRITPNEMVKE